MLQGSAGWARMAWMEGASTRMQGSRAPLLLHEMSGRGTAARPLFALPVWKHQRAWVARAFATRGTTGWTRGALCAGLRATTSSRMVIFTRHPQGCSWRTNKDPRGDHFFAPNHVGLLVLPRQR